MTQTRRLRRLYVQQWEYRCYVCGTWFQARREPKTCSGSCRVQLHRIRKKRKKADYEP